MSMNGRHGGWDQMESHQASVYGYGYAVNSTSHESFPYPGTFVSTKNDSPVPHGGDLPGEVYGYGYGVNSDYHKTFSFPGAFQSMENHSPVPQGGDLPGEVYGYGYGYGVNSDYHKTFSFPGTFQSMENNSSFLQGEVHGHEYGVNSDYHESFPFPETFQSMENDSTYGYGVNSDSHESFPFPGTSQSMENCSSLPHGGVLQGDVGYPTPLPAIDPRLLPLLEVFKELHMESPELFNKLFPRLEEEISEGRFVIEEQEDSMVRVLSEFFKKFPTILAQVNWSQMKFGTTQRSLSLESPRSPFMSGEESSLKIQRFKVRTLDLGGKGATKNGSPSN